jgi:hypothetical protein
MPKQKKKGKKEEDEGFDDMLAELQAADLPTARSASSAPATSSSSSIAGTNAGPSTTSLLSPAGQNVSEEAIIDACLAGNVGQLQRWGREGIRVTTAEPLLDSVSNGASFEVLSCLVKELGADVNQRGDEHGFTALAAAACQGYHDVIRYLVEELGADVNIPDNIGQKPLKVAAFNGLLPAVRMLLKLGADINQRDKNGATPLMIASSEKHHEIVKWLVKAGANTQILFTDHPKSTAASLSRALGASVEQTAYLEAKTHCSHPGCSGAGVMKCTGCKQARYCGGACQLAHWKAHKADCRRWSAELLARKGH